MKKIIFSIVVVLSVNAVHAMEKEKGTLVVSEEPRSFIQESLENIHSFPKPLRDLAKNKRKRRKHMVDLRALFSIITNIKTQVDKTSRETKHTINASSKTSDVESFIHFWSHSLSAINHLKYLEVIGEGYNQYSVAAYHIRCIGDRADWTPKNIADVIDTFVLVYGSELEKARKQVG